MRILWAVVFSLLTSPVYAAVRAVHAGDDLQAVLNAAQPGDEIVIDSGAIFPGNFVLPSKPDGPVIIVRTSGTLPDRRVTEADTGLMPTLAPPNVEPALSCTNSNNWRFDGIRFGSNPLGFYDVIGIDGCSNLTFNRIIIIGGPSGQKRGIRANTRNFTLTNSHIANIWAQGQDSQAVCAWNGPGPFTLTNNYLEAAGENVMFGGAASSSVENIPADITIVGNHFFKPLIWKSFDHPASVKNLLEFKAAKRATIKNNLFENNWTKSQNGYSILFTVRNDDGVNNEGQELGAPWTVVEDIVFESNILKGIENGFNILGYDGYAASGRTTRITIRHNLVLTQGTFLQIGGEAGFVTVDHNTVEDGFRVAILYPGDVWPTGQKKRPAQFAVEDFTFTNTLAYHNEYGVIGEGTGIGTPTLAGHAKTYRWTHNALAGVYTNPYPEVTWRPTVEQHKDQFNTDYTLKSTSIYKTAATDGTDLGATITAEVPPTPLPPLTVDATLKTTQCRLTVSALPPDDNGGWKIQFKRDGVNIGQPDASSPYERTHLVVAGTYKVSGVWTKTNQPTRTTEERVVTCGQ